ncbi:MAG: AbrB/MazE/SpoVT family DNA-binding domain-containing protein [Clostridiales Family XIII bacterium]|nr:AbrB/MazE/SpoVT family DNA-binding domain-containing protein [Clostridiales Family XIII bacterium]
MQTATINKWGNAEAVRLPSSFCRQLGISSGDIVSLELKKDKIILSTQKPKMPNTIQERMKFWDGKVYNSEELITGDVGLERWWEDEK